MNKRGWCVSQRMGCQWFIVEEALNRLAVYWTQHKSDVSVMLVCAYLCVSALVFNLE